MRDARCEMRDEKERVIGGLELVEGVAAVNTSSRRFAFFLKQGVSILATSGWGEHSLEAVGVSVGAAAGHGERIGRGSFGGRRHSVVCKSSRWLGTVHTRAKKCLHEGAG